MSTGGGGVLSILSIGYIFFEIYPFRSICIMRSLFPVCITVLWVIDCYTDRQTDRQPAILVYSRQSSYTDREKSSPLMTTGGGGGAIA